MRRRPGHGWPTGYPGSEAIGALAAAGVDDPGRGKGRGVWPAVDTQALRRTAHTMRRTCSSHQHALTRHGKIDQPPDWSPVADSTGGPSLSLVEGAVTWAPAAPQ
jgi:hypothetical protein